VRVVNQPFLFGWHDGALHIQAFDVLEDDPRDWKKAQAKLLNKALADRIQQELKARKEKIDWEAVSRLSHDPRGIPVSISGGPDQIDHIVAAATVGAEQSGARGNLGRHLRSARGRGYVPGARVRSRAFS
jgi:L,D-transpeptidase ErfK/SrfK